MSPWEEALYVVLVALADALTVGDLGRLRRVSCLSKDTVETLILSEHCIPIFARLVPMRVVFDTIRRSSFFCHECAAILTLADELLLLLDKNLQNQRKYHARLLGSEFHGFVTPQCCRRCHVCRP